MEGKGSCFQARYILHDNDEVFHEQLLHQDATLAYGIFHLLDFEYPGIRFHGDGAD